MTSYEVKTFDRQCNVFTRVNWKIYGTNRSAIFRPVKLLASKNLLTKIFLSPDVPFMATGSPVTQADKNSYSPGRNYRGGGLIVRGGGRQIKNIYSLGGYNKWEGWKSTIEP